MRNKGENLHNLRKTWHIVVKYSVVIINIIEYVISGCLSKLLEEYAMIMVTFPGWSYCQMFCLIYPCVAYPCQATCSDFGSINMGNKARIQSKFLPAYTKKGMLKTSKTSQLWHYLPIRRNLSLAPRKFQREASVSTMSRDLDVWLCPFQKKPVTVQSESFLIWGWEKGGSCPGSLDGVRAPKRRFPHLNREQ